MFCDDLELVMDDLGWWWDEDEEVWTNEFGDVVEDAEDYIFGRAADEAYDLAVDNDLERRC